jgi:hypothetical protein
LDTANTPHMRCAKRPSASQRLADTNGATMKRQRFEPEGTHGCVVWRNFEEDVASTDAACVVARLRRDCRTALRRTPMSICRESAMANISILGRAVRLMGSWYALCTLCAAPMRVNFQRSWHADALWCTQCTVPAETSIDESDKLVSLSCGMIACCRYCGVHRERSDHRWHDVPAPHDLAGGNADCPSPLRRVHYCRLHYRDWLAHAHQVLNTREIIAHIAHNARPVFQPDDD